MFLHLIGVSLAESFNLVSNVEIMIQSVIALMTMILRYL